MDEVFLENVPALWSMKSIDELLQYLWVTEWGMPSEQYSRSQAETIFADLFVSDFTQQQENYGYGLNPPHPSFFRDLPSDVTLDADTYLRYMWQDVWRNNQPFNYSQAETQFILSYGVSLDDLSFIEEVNSQNITPELQALLDSPFASVFYATSNTSNGQQTLAELIEEYGMDAFIAYYNDFAQLSSNAGVLQNSELTDYVQSYLYLQALENGDELPFTPEFNPDAATDNMLFAEGVLLSYGEEGVQDDGIGRWMIERTAIMLSMLPEFEGANTEDIENELYALLPENFTGEDAANLANDIAFQLSTTIQAMSAADPDLVPRHRGK